MFKQLTVEDISMPENPIQTEIRLTNQTSQVFTCGKRLRRPWQSFGAL